MPKANSNKVRKCKMKKLLALLLAVVMVAGLAACGSSAPASGSGDAEPAASSGDAVRLFNGKIEIAEPLEHADQEPGGRRCGIS